MSKKPLKYFLSEISPYRPIKAICPCCETKTTYSSYIDLNTSEGSLQINYYQCQSCGKLETSDQKDADGIRVALEKMCECGGQYRRDKNIFCPKCQYRQSDENKAEDKLFATPEEMENFALRHGTEELKSGYKGEGSVIEKEDSDVKKIIKALRELTKDGSEYNFGFETGGKGGSHFFDKGLNKEIEFLLYTWMMQVLLPKSNHHSTDYTVTYTESGIMIKCIAFWDGNEYEDTYYPYETIFNEEIVNLLLPDLDYDNVNIEDLSLSFDYMNEVDNYHFFWKSDTIEYYENENNKEFTIDLNDLKPKLEKLLHENLRDLESGSSVPYKGETTITVTVENGEVKVSEIAGFDLYFNLEDY